MLLSVLLIWAELIMAIGLIGQPTAQHPEGGISALSKKERQRTMSEVRFIQMEFGVEYNPRKLSRREKLSLALTNAISDSQ